MKNIVLIASLAFAGVMPGFADLVNNGDFENPDISHNTIGPGLNWYLTVGGGDSATIPSWTVSGTSVDIVNVIGGGSPSWAHNGLQAIDLAGSPGPGTISQTLVTVPGRTYLLSFWYSSNGGPYTDGLVVDWGTSSIVLDTPAFGTWTHFVAPVKALGASTTLSLGTSISTYQGPLVDQVSVTPELSSIGFLGVALMLTFVFARRLRLVL
jgi:hypothetical protein